MKKLITTVLLMVLASVSYGQAKSALDEIISIDRLSWLTGNWKGPRDGGVLVRAGHTEASVDLARLAGFEPAGTICEIMNDDGTMARIPDLVDFSNKHNTIINK